MHDGSAYLDVDLSHSFMYIMFVLIAAKLYQSTRASQILPVTSILIANCTP